MHFQNILKWGLQAVLLVSALSLHAQDPRTDSLRNLLAHLPPDTHRVTVLNTIADRLKTNEFKESLVHIQEAIRLADSLHFPQGLADAKASNAELQNNLGAYEVSMQNAMEAHDLYKALGDYRGMGRALMSLGLVENHLNLYDKSLVTLDKAARSYEKVNDKRGSISAKHNIAVVYSAKGDTAKSRAQYEANLRALQGTAFYHIFAATYNNIGNLLDPVTEGDSAIYFYETALEYKYKAKIPSNSSIANSLMNIAHVHTKRGELKKAEARLKKADSLLAGSEEKVRIMQLHEYWGQLYFKMGRYKESAQHFELQTIFQDSLYEPQMVEQATRLSAAYQSDDQQKEIELLNQAKALDDVEKTQWRWIAGFIAVGLLLSLALLVMVILRGRERSRMLNLLEQKGNEIKRQQQEIVLQNEVLSIQNKRLEDVNKEKDGLIGIVAHDIRAPLNRSAALAELILGQGELSAEQQKYLHMIRKVADDGGRLIQDLLELNSYENQQMKVEMAQVDLGDLVDHSLHGFAKAAADKSITIHWERQPVTVKTDEKLLGRILDNLISNAVKFTPKGKNIHLGLEQNGSRVWMVVRDEGPGISDADKQKMFQKFQRLAARPTGGESSTGLGLSIVKTLAMRIGAEIEFESEVGKGTAFRVGIKQE